MITAKKLYYLYFNNLLLRARVYSVIWLVWYSHTRVEAWITRETILSQLG